MKVIWKELRMFYRRLRHAGPPDELRRECNEAMAWADKSLIWVKETMIEVEKRFIRMWEMWTGMVAPPDLKPYPVYYQVLATWFMLVGAWFAIAFECLLQGALSVMVFNLPWVWAALVGIAITLAVTYLFKGLFSMFFARYSQHPKQAQHILIWSVVLLLPVQIILLGVLFLVTRSFADTSESLLWLFWPVSSLLALSTPILAAILLVGAGLFGWSRVLVDNYDELSIAERKIWALRLHADAIKPIILLVVSALVFGAGSVCAQMPSKAHTETQRITADKDFQSDPSSGGAKRGLVITDGTGSVNQRDLQVAVGAVANHLDLMTLRWDIREWEFYVFTNDAWTMNPYYRIQMPAFKMPECTTPRFSKVEILFKGQVEARERRAREECRALVDNAQKRYEAALKNKLNEAQASLIVPLAVNETCTSFWDLLYRLSEMSVPTTAVIITDAEETCRDATEPIPSPKGNVRVVIVLLSTRKAEARGITPAQEFLEQRQKVKKLAPWIGGTDIMAPFSLGALFNDGEKVDKRSLEVARVSRE